MKEKLLNTINHYGVNHQQRKLAEEHFELQEAIHDIEHFDNMYPDDIRNLTLEKNREAFVKHVTEEIADVMVLLNQFAFYYDIKMEDINNMMSYKVNRQLERIKNGE